jgi:hypothetical protein
LLTELKALTPTPNMLSKEEMALGAFLTAVCSADALSDGSSYSPVGPSLVTERSVVWLWLVLRCCAVPRTIAAKDLAVLVYLETFIQPV